MQIRIDWPIWRESMIVTPLLVSVPYILLRNTALHPVIVTLLMLVGVWLLIVGTHAVAPQERVNLPTIAISTGLAVLPWFFFILFLERYALWVTIWFLVNIGILSY